MRNAHGNPWRDIPLEIRLRAQKIMAEHGDGGTRAKHGWSIYHSPTTQRPFTICILRYHTIKGVLYEWDLLNE